MAFVRREYPFFNTAASVGKARYLLRNTLAAWQCGDDVIDDALLIVSELASNAVQHSESSVFVVVCQLDSNLLTIGVIDYGEQPPRPHATDLLSEHGRGLAVVAALADDYGVLPHEQGKFIFAGLHVTEPPPDVISSERGHRTASVCFT